jgi:hypothetical protein
METEKMRDRMNPKDAIERRETGLLAKEGDREEE